MEIGQKLKDKRTGLGLSQEQLAEQLGVTRQTIANWEKGKTYPDIGSVLKLSDLYSVSLDELLKEDTDMRKHVEESAELPRKYWNMLFELAILLMPFGGLVAYWGAQWVGIALEVIGILMLPPLWVTRYRLFGTSKEDLKYSIIGWVVAVVAIILRLVLTDSLFLPLGLIQLAGAYLIWTHGIYLERSTRFWLVIALYFGIPVFVIGSSFLEQFSDMGAFSKAQPLGEYRIVQAEFGEAEDPNLIVSMDQSLTSMYLKLDEERIGEFQYVEPAKYQEETVKGIWHLVPEEDPEALYKLEVDAEDKTTLSYLEDDQLQWRWELQEIPKAWFALNNTEFTSAHEMDWFNEGTYTSDLSTVNTTTFPGEGTAYLQCRFEGVNELTIKEEYHHGDQVEYREYFLTKDKNDNYPLPEDALEKRYEDADQYILYRLQWEDGEFLFRLKFK